MAINNGEKCHMEIDGEPLDAHALMQVEKWCLYTDTLLDLARNAPTYAEGLFWMHLRKSNLDGMLRMVRSMQFEFKGDEDE